jgi:hypothetical protein
MNKLKKSLINLFDKLKTKPLKLNADELFTLFCIVAVVNTIIELSTLSTYKPWELDKVFLVVIGFVALTYAVCCYCIKIQAIENNRWYWILPVYSFFGYLIVDQFVHMNPELSTFQIHPSVITFYDCYLALPFLFLISVRIMFVLVNNRR